MKNAVESLNYISLEAFWRNEALPGINILTQLEGTCKILQGLRVAQAAVTERWPSRKIARK